MNITQFIQSQIGTVDHLRALMLLYGSPRTEWDVIDVATKLYLPPDRLGVVLSELEARGLVITCGQPPRYRYEAKSQELTLLVREVVELDRTHPVSLIQLIYGEFGGVKAFADAFKLRKEKEG